MNRSYEFGMIMKKIQDPCICKIEDEETEYTNGADALSKIEGYYRIDSVGAEDGKVWVKLINGDKDADEHEKMWIQEYVKENGVEPGFF